jgi:hypothetical protein
MASKSKRSRYRGALASPIVRQPPPSFWGAVTPKRLNEYYRSVARHERNQAKEIERHLSRRFSLLFDYYGIKDRRNTRALAWALAREHVKGFQLVKPTNKKRGRRSVWDGERLGRCGGALCIKIVPRTSAVDQPPFLRGRPGVHEMAQNCRFTCFGTWAALCWSIFASRQI